MAKLPLQFHPEARLEALDAYSWYFDRSPRAAEGFQAELGRAGEAIQESPERFGNYLHGTRRYLMKRYTYLVVYRPTPNRIEIVAVAHGHRRPGYWKTRLNRPQNPT